jgi:hypothetical protein
MNSQIFVLNMFVTYFKGLMLSLSEDGNKSQVGTRKQHYYKASRHPGILGMPGKLYKESYANAYAAVNVKSALEKLINVLQPTIQGTKRHHHSHPLQINGHGHEEPHEISKFKDTNTTVVASSILERKSPRKLGNHNHRNIGDEALNLAIHSREKPTTSLRQDLPPNKETSKEEDTQSVAFFSCKEEFVTMPQKLLRNMSPTTSSHRHVQQQDHNPKKKVAVVNMDLYPLIDGYVGAHIPPFLHDQV